MTYKQKITKIGNSIGVVIPKEIRDLLGLKLGSDMFLVPSLDGKSIIMNYKEPRTKIDPEFFEIVKQIDKEYSSALKELASK